MLSLSFIFDNIAYLNKNRMWAIERIKVKLRANKYKNKTDVGGIKYLLEHVSPGQTVFDIGAHKGGYIYFLSKLVGEKGQVFAFEPQLQLYNYLTDMMLAMHWRNLQHEFIALSDYQGMATLYIPANKHDSSSPGATIITNPERKNFRTQEVRTNTLDNYCKEYNIKPDLLKVDVEGNELNVFKGGVNTLKQYKPKILFECEERHVGKEKVLETFKFLQDLGYRGFFIKDDEFIPLSQFDFAKHQDVSRKPYCNNFIFE
jgi:FkbM family methyltransferase